MQQGWKKQPVFLAAMASATGPALDRDVRVAVDQVVRLRVAAAGALAGSQAVRRAQDEGLMRQGLAQPLDCRRAARRRLGRVKRPFLPG
ncbi:hypothetical protein GCM10010232_38240 [Streptomyces amakusaensis]